jgi:hypothetical protein
VAAAPNRPGRPAVILLTLFIYFISTFDRIVPVFG